MNSPGHEILARKPSPACSTLNYSPRKTFGLSCGSPSLAGGTAGSWAEPAKDKQGHGGARRSFAAAQSKAAGAGIHCQPWEQIPACPYSRDSLGIRLLALSKPLSAGTKAVPAPLLSLKEYPCFLELSVLSAFRAVPTTPTRTTQDSRRRL